MSRIRRAPHLVYVSSYLSATTQERNISQSRLLRVSPMLTSDLAQKLLTLGMSTLEQTHWDNCIIINYNSDVVSRIKNQVNIKFTLESSKIVALYCY